MYILSICCFIEIHSGHFPLDSLCCVNTTLDLMQFQMEELAGEIGDRKIILEDTIVVEKDSLFCRSRGTKTRGVNCLSRILRQTNWNGLRFRNV